MDNQGQDPIETPGSYRPDLPDWGVYLSWPEAGESWIHSEDVALAKHLVPSQRIFRRSAWDGSYYWLHYGELRLRVKPTMWVRVAQVDLDVGCQVEVLSRHGKNEAGIFRVGDILWEPHDGRVAFYLLRDNLPLKRSFSRQDLRPLHVRHNLRTGYFEHPAARFSVPDDVELLDVGDLFSDP